MVLATHILRDVRYSLVIHATVSSVSRRDNEDAKGIFPRPWR
jgi:hypothetical protein